MAKDNITKRVSIYINGEEVENSLKGVEGAMAKVRNQLRKLNTDSDTYDQDSKDLVKTMEALKEKQADYREELGLTSNAMKDNQKISEIWGSLLSGNLQDVKQGIGGLTTGFGGLIKASLAFIATPIGAAIAALAGLVAGGKFLFDFNSGLEVMNKELRALGAGGEGMSALRDEIKATADTFDKDFKDIAEKANSLSKTYKISMSEANAFIAQGLADGGAQNSEFLDSLGEYDEFFANAGYSAKEFIDIINTGYDLGIYADKLPDALKEADLALKENTKSTRDALVNAFGASFSDDILNRVKNGEITTKTALEEIAKKAKETSLSQQQQAQLTADVFKGAGEDAGGALKIFEAISKSATRELDATAQSQLRLVEANEKLNKAQAELFEIDGFGDMWTGIKVLATESLASIITYLADLKKDIQPVIDLVVFAFAFAWENLKMTVTAVFDVIGGVVKAFSSYFGGIIEGIKRLLKGDFIGAFYAVAEGVGNAFRSIGNVFMDLYNGVITFITRLVEASAPILEALGIDVDKLNKKIESLKGKKFEIKGEIKIKETNTSSATQSQITGSGGGGASADAIKEREKAEDAARKKREAEEKKAADAEKARYKALIDAKIGLAKAELDYFVLSNKSKLEKNGQLTQDLIAGETARLKAILDKQQLFNEQEKTRKTAEIEASALSEEEKVARLQTINLEYQGKKQELELGFQLSTSELKKQFEEQEKVLKAEQLLLENELALAESETKFEEDRIKESERYRLQLADLDERLKKGKLTNDQYNTLIEGANNIHSDNNIKIARAERDAKAAEYGELFGNIATLLGENTEAGKMAALATVAISQGLAVARIWETESTLPSPFDVAAKIAGTTVAVANVLAAGKKINSVNTPKTKSSKFFYGGATGTNAALGYDEYGAVTGYVHKNEYVIPEVMTQDPRFADTIGWLEHNRQQRLKGFIDGGEVSPGVVKSNNSSQSMDNSAMLVNAVNTLNSILSSGITAKLNLGYNDVKGIDEMNNELKTSSQNGTIG